MPGSKGSHQTLQIKVGSFRDGQLKHQDGWERRGGECLALREDHTALYSNSSSELTLRDSLAHGHQKHSGILLIYLKAMPVLRTD